MKTELIYRQLIKQVLVENNVESIIRIDDVDTKFFERVHIDADGNLEVYDHGIEKPWRDFLFDFTLDYAHLLSYIEDEIFMQTRGGKPLHGYRISFKPKTQR